MTKNDAIQTLKDHKILFEHDFGWNKSVLDALDMAIEALHEQKEKKVVAIDELVEKKVVAIDELVKRLGEHAEFARNQYEKDYEALCACLPKWISVTERLPEPYTWVLVSAENHKVALDAFFDGDQWKDAVLNGLIVTHWMPLPKPPKRGGRQ